MRANGGGTIVQHLVDAWGAHGRRPGISAYVATKAAVSALTRNAALEHIADGIRINAISPGPVDTPMSLRPARPRPTVRPGCGPRADRPRRRAGGDHVAVLWLASAESGFTSATTSSSTAAPPCDQSPWTPGVPERVGDGLRGPAPGLREQVVDVGLHGRLRDVQPLRDLHVGRPAAMSCRQAGCGSEFSGLSRCGPPTAHRSPSAGLGLVRCWLLLALNANHVVGSTRSWRRSTATSRRGRAGAVAGARVPAA